MKKTIAFAFLLFTILSSCKDSGEIVVTNSEQQGINQETFDKGFAVMEKNCFSCHSPNPSSSNNIASTFAEIKTELLNNFQSENAFYLAISEYISAPSKKNAFVQGAYKKYGAMPKMEFSAEELKAVAHYLYHAEIESSNWYSESYPKEKEKFLSQTKNEDKSYVEQGREFAMATKSVLGKNLMGKIKSVGTDEALSFCNIRAIPLVDSMSTVLNANIKRVSDKNRNPNNEANEMELAYIQKAKQELSNGKKIKPQVKEIDGKMVGYYPILTNKMCMQCHGQPESQIKNSTLELLKNYYPNDKAVGYGEDELRGIWVVTMEK